MSEERTVALDELRHWLVELGVAAGLKPGWATVWARYTIWSEVVSREGFGLASVPLVLEKLAGKEFDPKAEPKLALERPAVAVLKAGRALPALVIARAVELSEQKAREAGIGSVRIVGLGDALGADPLVIASELGAGPYQSRVVGPGARRSVGFPTGRTPALLHEEKRAVGIAPEAPCPADPEAVGLAAEDVLVITQAVNLVEPLEAYGERTLRWAGELAARQDGWLTPTFQEDLRRRAEQQGLSLAEPTKSALAEWAERLRVGRTWS